MTKAEPFEFQTDKRAKYGELMNFDDQPKEKQEYVPLWKQVEQSFQLRPENEDARFESLLLGP